MYKWSKKIIIYMKIGVKDGMKDKCHEIIIMNTVKNIFGGLWKYYTITSFTGDKYGPFSEELVKQ